MVKAVGSLLKMGWEQTYCSEGMIIWIEWSEVF
jgi:hypothetical protein